MTILNEIESTAETPIKDISTEVAAGESILTNVETDVTNIAKEVGEIASSAEEDVKEVIAEPAHILSQAHSFFDLCKSKLEHVIGDIMQHAESTEEAIEAAILTAFGHATNETHASTAEVQSS